MKKSTTAKCDKLYKVNIYIPDQLLQSLFDYTCCRKSIPQNDLNQDNTLVPITVSVRGLVVGWQMASGKRQGGIKIATSPSRCCRYL